MTLNIQDSKPKDQSDALEGMKAKLKKYGYEFGVRDPKVKPEFAGEFMVFDAEDGEDGYAIVGSNLAELVKEAYDHLLSCAEQAKV